MSKKNGLPPSQLTSENVKEYLKSHPEFLETFLLTPSNRDILIKTYNKRLQKDAANNKKAKTNGTSERKADGIEFKGSEEWKTDGLEKKRRVLLEMGGEDKNWEECKEAMFSQLVAACVEAVHADDAFLFLITDKDQELRFVESFKQNDSGNSRPGSVVQGKDKLVGYVAQQMETVRSDDISKDSRFSKCSDMVGNGVGPLLALPLIDTSGVLLGVLELVRNTESPTFKARDEQIVSILLLWGCVGIFYSELFHSMNRQRKLNDFLLTVAKSIFQDIVSMDTVIMKVMNFAQNLVDADRASLFLVDSKTNELYARIFDVGTDTDEQENLDSNGSKEIRFPMDRGIAGHVASTGQVLNIPDAYTDHRFNSEVDVKTGYRTKTILCMPIFIRGNVIGVVQMVNKHTGLFTKQDENSFETFAIYCGLALHHAKLYDKIRRSEQKYKVALEVLAYHSVSNRDEVNKIKKQSLPNRVTELETFDYNSLKLTELQKPLYAIYMFKDLFGLQRFDEDDLIRFVLTVRKNYRRVPYHNWTHGWSVAHAMYNILKENKKLFTPNERLAMYVGSLCHDLDHRGKNNAYMKNMNSPLAAIYSTSVMEHHHFNQTVTILQQDGHNIFKNLSSQDYHWVLRNIKHCILATDLALFFPNKANLKKLVDAKAFQWNDADQRLVLQAVSMTGCDLIASAKPWAIQTDTAKVIFEEFYEQGDAERANGKEPIPMMDRHKAHELPQMQVGFIKGICLPCYDVLSSLIPCTKDLAEKCRYNLTKWSELAEEKKSIQDDK